MIPLTITIALVTVATCNILIGLFPITAYRKHGSHYWFSLLFFSMAAWTIGISNILLSTDKSAAYIWAYTLYIAAVFMAVTLIKFALSFPQKISLNKYTNASLYISALVIIFLIVLPKNGVFADILIRPDAGNIVLMNNVQYLIYSGYLFVVFLSAVIVFAKNYKQATRLKQNQLIRQIRAITIGTLFTILFASVFNLLLPFFKIYTLIWMGPLSIAAYGSAIVYGVAKQGVLDLRKALTRSTMYFLVIIALAFLYMVVVQSLLRPIYRDWDQDSIWYILAQTTIVVALALSVAPLRKFFDNATNRIFYNAGYQPEEVSNQLRSIISKESKLSLSIKKSFEVIKQNLTPRYISIVLFDLDGHVNHYNAAGASASKHQSDLHCDLVNNHLDMLDPITIVQDVDRLENTTVTQLLTAAHASIAIKFGVQERYVGALFLGRKKQGYKYNAKDMQVLTTYADEFALAIENSLHYQEIEKFNINLQHSINDATKKLRASNRQLQRLDASKDEFVSMASHQLRTPLTSIKGYISMVLEGDAGKIEPMQAKLLDEAFNASERMVHLINDFLNVSRLQTGKFILDIHKTDLVKLISQEIKGLQLTAKSHDLEIKFTHPNYFPVLNVDAGKIRQVIMNFIDNAIYYSPEASTIQVVIDIEDGQALFKVIDKGIGVPKEQQDRLFTKFFRASNARRQRPDGTGVGIFLAKRVINEHGGSIIFESIEGKGSTFGFRLPIKRLTDDETQS